MPVLQRLPTSAIILVCDARKALFLRNRGTAVRPSLDVLQSREAEPATADRDLKGNPPGRMPDSRPGDGTHGPKSAMEQPDYARLDEEAFAASLAAECVKLLGKDGLDSVVVAAPPRMLGALRQAFPPNSRKALLAEIPKVLTQFQVGEIAGHLVAEW